MKGKAIRKGVFIPAFSCVLIAGAVGLINNQLLISFFKGAFELVVSVDRIDNRNPLRDSYI